MTAVDAFSAVLQGLDLGALRAQPLAAGQPLFDDPRALVPDVQPLLAMTASPRSWPS